ncbi:hypothetical protein BaRGS_00013599 [Batillaria attramentaria]|uniref:Uncharacterized protein n=1 Tax=Batillaria attramentaria TaxID=370345 RepID=A0ABD0L7V0_9CAEN
MPCRSLKTDFQVINEVIKNRKPLEIVWGHLNKSLWGNRTQAYSAVREKILQKPSKILQTVACIEMYQACTFEQGFEITTTAYCLRQSLERVKTVT